MFLGTHAPRLAEKSRFILPARFREELADGVILTRGQERCLYVFTTAEFERMYAQLREAPLAQRHLDVVHQNGDLLGSVTRAFRQPLHLFGNDREAASGLASDGGLHGGVQGQDVRAFGDGVDQIDDAADFLGTLTQALDAFFGFGNGLADGFHEITFSRSDRRLVQ